MSENTSPDIGSLFSNPEALTSIARIMRGIGSEGIESNKIIESVANGEEALSQHTERLSDNVRENSSQSQTAETDPLSAMLSNPELMAKLPQMISAVKPLLSSLQGSGTTISGGNAEQKHNGTHSDSSAHAALLGALRPYLSKPRQDALDGIVRITGLIEVIRLLNQPDSRNGG